MGDRYHHKVWDDYDLCSQCFSENAENYHILPDDYLLVPHSTLYPTNFMGPTYSDTLNEIFFINFAELPCCQHKNAAGEIEVLSYSEFGIKALQVTKALEYYCSAESQTMIGLISENSLPWLVIDVACLFGRYISVPFHNFTTPEQIALIIEETGMSIVVTSKQFISKMVDVINNAKSTIKYLIVIEDLTMEELNECKNLQTDTQVITLNRLIKDGLNKMRDNRNTTQGDIIINSKNYLIELGGINKLEDNDIVTLVYTSGSTGKPKGAVLREKQYFANLIVGSTYSSPYPLFAFLYLPFSHLMERDNFTMTCLFGGLSYIFTSNMDELWNETSLIRPSFFLSVPRLWNEFYSSFQLKLTLELKANQGSSNPLEESEIIEIVKKEWRDKLGERVKMIYSGSAKIDKKVIEFLKDLFPTSLIVDSYGLTEVGGISTNGVIMKNLLWKIEDVPELNYYSTDKPYARGELIVKSTTTIQEYFKTTITSEQFDENGWFHTGDIVSIINEKEGCIEIIDRRKFIFKNSQGEFISPENIECIFLKSSFIQQIYIHGNIDEKYLIAIVLPNFKNIEKILSEEEMKDEKIIKKLIFNEFKALATENSLQSYEVPMGVILNNFLFSPENQLLTPSLKNARSKIYEYFKTKFEEEYKNIDSSQKQLLKMLNDFTINSKNQSKDEKTEINLENLFEFGFDSLAAVQLKKFLENRLNISVPLENIFNFKSMEDILLFSQNTAKDTSSELSNQYFANFSEINSDAKLNIQGFDKNSLKIPKNYHKKILVTGATGFLGQFLLKKLFDSIPDASFHVLIRAESETEAISRFTSVFSIFPDFSWENYSKRVTVYPADVGKPKFNLTDAKYEFLLKEIDSLFHCAAKVHWLVSYDSLRESNVLSTKNLIEFALTTKLKRFYFISTISVVQNVEMDESPISFMPLDYSLLPSSGYVLSKYICEYLLYSAKQLGLFVLIFRPGMISSDSLYGFYPANQFYSQYIQTCVQFNSFPAVKSIHNDFAPVDFVANAIVELSEQFKSSNSPPCSFVFNLSNTNLFDFSLFSSFLTSFGLSEIPLEEWMMLLRNSPASPLYPLAVMDNDTVFSPSSVFPAKIFSLHLGVNYYPRLSDSYFQLFFKREINKTKRP